VVSPLLLTVPLGFLLEEEEDWGQPEYVSLPALLPTMALLTPDGTMGIAKVSSSDVVRTKFLMSCEKTIDFLLFMPIVFD